MIQMWEELDLKMVYQWPRTGSSIKYRTLHELSRPVQLSYILRNGLLKPERQRKGVSSNITRLTKRLTESARNMVDTNIWFYRLSVSWIYGIGKPTTHKM
jgi:hypothetical protein